MNYIQRMGTVLNDHIFGITGNETPVEKYTKLAVGVGVTGLAVIAWKITVTAGFFYSAYKGGEMAYSRFFQRKDVRRESAAAANADLDEVQQPLIIPVAGGHDAHGDDQQEEPAREPEEVPLSGVEKLKALRKEWAQNPRVKDLSKMHLVFKAMISHPEALAMGGNLVWIQEKMRKYSKNGNLKLRWLRFKHRFQCYEKPKSEAPK